MMDSLKSALVAKNLPLQPNQLIMADSSKSSTEELLLCRILRSDLRLPGCQVSNPNVLTYLGGGELARRGLA